MVIRKGEKRERHEYSRRGSHERTQTGLEHEWVLAEELGMEHLGTGWFCKHCGRRKGPRNGDERACRRGAEFVSEHEWWRMKTGQEFRKAFGRAARFLREQQAEDD